MTHPIQVTINL